MKENKDIELESWEDFPDALQKLDLDREKSKQSKDTTYYSDFVFRGQSNSGWKLETTLDRYVDGSMSVSEYYHKIFFAKAQIESFTEQTWDIPTIKEHNEWLDTLEMLSLENPMAYEYITYLRHHGFPSPLLDWTRAPYLAAFFAFDGAKEREGTDRIAIYAYLEYAGKGKDARSNCPRITTLGPYIKTHRRHFLQQSIYTICKTGSRGQEVYTSHEDAISRGEGEQDRVMKITIPKKERLVALKHLDSLNINAYSLFGSEESLMRTIALREFKFEGLP